MSRIELDLAHAYRPHPREDSDYALLPLRMTFEDGGAYALLGPSGCGKTTMLNIISGLVAPSHGDVKFDGQDVTQRSPQQRNIAQVFQFPVIYDTMTVAENLAFPLRNRRVPQAQIDKRVGEIAEMLELSGQLNQRAANLAADAKQKISLGRGLVRPDVSAVLFDEPLTVIDPHLKWQLRRKLKQIHHELKLTLIYVTHDQVEALTFADQVVVMTRGRAVQVGGADALFERPQHTFVGHFIGSPGMNFIPAQSAPGELRIAGKAMPPGARVLPDGDLKLGVRPEYVRLAAPGDAGALPAEVTQVQDIGTYLMLTATIAGQPVKARLTPETRAPQPGQTVWLQLLGEHTCFYKDEELHAALLRQLTFSLAVLAVEIPLGIALALSMPAQGWKASAVLVIVALSLLIPWNVVGTIWQIYGRADIGLLGAGLQWLGIDYSYTGNARDAWITVLAMDVWHWTPLVALLCYAGLRSIPDAYYQAARIDGASRIAVFRYIQLPKMRGVLMIAVLLRFMDSFMIYTEPFVLTGGGPGNATTFLSQFLTQKAVGQFDLGPAAAFSLIYFLIILLLCFVLYNWMQRVGTQEKEVTA